MKFNNIFLIIGIVLLSFNFVKSRYKLKKRYKLKS